MIAGVKRTATDSRRPAIKQSPASLVLQRSSKFHGATCPQKCPQHVGVAAELGLLCRQVRVNRRSASRTQTLSHHASNLFAKSCGNPADAPNQHVPRSPGQKKTGQESKPQEPILVRQLFPTRRSARFEVLPTALPPRRIMDNINRIFLSAYIRRALINDYFMGRNHFDEKRVPVHQGLLVVHPCKPE